MPAALMPSLLLWAVQVAPSSAQRANGLVVRLTAQQAEHRPPYTAILTAGETSQGVPLNDDGRGSDVRTGDDLWTGEAWSDATSFSVSLKTADGTLPGGEISWTTDATNRDVVMTLDGEPLQVSAEVATPAANAGAGDGMDPGREPARADRERAAIAPADTVLGWWVAGAIALLGTAGVLAGLLVRFRQARALAALHPLPAPRVAGLPSLPAEDSLHQPDGTPPADLAAHLVAELAHSGPVVLIAPEGLPLGETWPAGVFRFGAPPRQLALTLRALMARSVAPPTLVALVDPPDARTVEDLAQNLPEAVRALFVLTSLPPLPDVPCFRWHRSGGTWQAEPAEVGPAEERS